MGDEKLRQVRVQVHLQILRLRLLVGLNHVYPAKLDLATLQEMLRSYHEDEGQRRIGKELYYLSEIGFVQTRHNERWRITARGRDFLLGLVEAKGVREPVGFGDIGET